MAKKIECDRCGKLVEDKSTGSEVMAITLTYTNKHASNGYVKYDYDWEEETVSKDLCNNCQKELLALFNKVDSKDAQG